MISPMTNKVRGNATADMKSPSPAATKLAISRFASSATWGRSARMAAGETGGLIKFRRRMWSGGSADINDPVPAGSAEGGWRFPNRVSRNTSAQS
jgi:hypothetical protein